MGMHDWGATAGIVGWSCAVEWFDWIERVMEIFGIGRVVLGEGLDTVSVDLGGHG